MGKIKMKPIHTKNLLMVIKANTVGIHLGRLLLKDWNLSAFIVSCNHEVVTRTSADSLTNSSYIQTGK